MFRDLAETAIAAVGTALVLYGIVKAFELLDKGAAKLGPTGESLVKNLMFVLALSCFVVPMLYYFRKAGWI